MLLDPVVGKLTADWLGLQNSKSMVRLASSTHLNSELKELAQQ
jgi:hypothetical protein